MYALILKPKNSLLIGSALTFVANNFLCDIQDAIQCEINSKDMALHTVIIKILLALLTIHQ